MMSSGSKETRREKFERVFERIRNELVDHFAKEGMPREAVEWYRNVSTTFVSSIFTADVNL
jgi:farnesyl diphosphate synthase